VLRNLLTHSAIIVTGVCLLLNAPKTSAESVPLPELIVSVEDQQMALVRDGQLVAKYPISTSKFGLGDARGSYKTPLGRLRVCEKHGEALATGAVLKGRHATGEILQVNAPGRDPIVTRILWLEGLEEQNRNARARAIYIHGTPEEKNIGKPVSWGCIRMRSRDVIALYDQVPLGAEVLIMNDRLPRIPKFDPDREILVAQHVTTTLHTPDSTAKQTSVPLKRESALTFSGPGFSGSGAGGAGARDAMKGSILLSGLSARPDEGEQQRIADRRATIEMLQRTPQ
jgi:hypothetical protein